MTRERISLSVEPWLKDILGKVGDGSEYVSRLVERRWRAWQEALATVKEAKWRASEVKAVCDVANGSALSPASLGNQLAFEMHEAAEHSDIATKWDIAPPRWSALCREVSDSEELAQALELVVEEFWSGNQELERKLDLLG